MRITPKFDINDKVFGIHTEVITKQHPCPDCLGEKEWTVISPAGSEYKFDCPRCRASYLSNQDASLKYPVHTSKIRRLTIGSVRTDSNDKERPVSYMCVETGIGSGAIHYEDTLFLNKEDADIGAQILADKRNSENTQFIKRYRDSLSVSDYQLKALEKS